MKGYILHCPHSVFCQTNKSFQAAACKLNIHFYCSRLRRAAFPASRLGLHAEAVHADPGVGGAVRHGRPGRPDLQRGVPALRGQAVRAVRAQRRLRPPAGGPDREDGDGGQPSAQHQLLLHRGGAERGVRAAAQQEVLHPGQRVHQPARSVPPHFVHF